VFIDVRIFVQSIATQRPKKIKEKTNEDSKKENSRKSIF